MTRALTALALMLFTAACQQPPPPSDYTMPRFHDRPAIPIQAAELEVVRRYQPSQEAPHVERAFPVQLDDAVDQWLHDRIRLIDEIGTVRFTIMEASVTEQPAPAPDGLKGAFTEKQTRFDARLLVRGMLEQRPPMTRDAIVVADVRLSRTQDADASLRQRHDLFYDMMQEVMRRFDVTMSRQLRAQMAPFDSVDSWKP